MAFLGSFLRIMLLIAVALLLIGGVLFLQEKGIEKRDYHQFNQEVNLVGKGIPLMKTGLAFLALTPIFTMIFSLVVFFYRRDVLYMIITLIVIIILSYSLSMSH